MKATAVCRKCWGCIRLAYNDDGQMVAINPSATPTGNVWVIDWNSQGLPLVAVAESSADVPANEPLRYVLHEC